MPENNDASKNAEKSVVATVYTEEDLLELEGDDLIAVAVEFGVLEPDTKPEVAPKRKVLVKSILDKQKRAEEEAAKHIDTAEEAAAKAEADKAKELEAEEAANAEAEEKRLAEEALVRQNDLIRKQKEEEAARTLEAEKQAALVKAEEDAAAEKRKAEADAEAEEIKEAQSEVPKAGYKFPIAVWSVVIDFIAKKQKDGNRFPMQEVMVDGELFVVSVNDDATHVAVSHEGRPYDAHLKSLQINKFLNSTGVDAGIITPQMSRAERRAALAAHRAASADVIEEEENTLESLMKELSSLRGTGITRIPMAGWDEAIVKPVKLKK